MKYLGIKLTVHVQDLYTENYKTVLTESSGGLSKWRDATCLWGGELNIISTSVLSRVIDRFIATQIKNSAGCFVGIDEPILKLPWKCRESRIVTKAFEKEQSWRTNTT